MGWFHDGSAAGQVKLGFGNNWVVAAIVVTLPFVSRPVALPVLAALAVKGVTGRNPTWPVTWLDSLAERFGDRVIHVVGDAAYVCGSFAGLGHDMTMTSRARSTATVAITQRACLWYGTWRTDLVRDTRRKSDPTSGYDLALVTTDLTATPEEIIARYATRWSIEVTFFDVKNILGVGQARNRVRKAVERTVPFGLFCHTLVILCYAQYGHPATDTAHRRASAPWYRAKTEPATLDMLTTLHHQIIATTKRRGRPLRSLRSVAFGCC